MLRFGLVISVLAWACQAPRATEVQSEPKAGVAPSASSRPKQAPTAAHATASAAAAPQALYLPPTDEAKGQVPSVAASSSGAAAETSRAPTIFRVAAVGDSLTDARSHGGKYLAYLRTRCPKSSFEDYGVGGEMVNQMRRRFARDVLSTPGRYTHVLVFGGVNDLYSDLTAGRTPAKIEADLAAMYAEAHAAGLSVVALTVAPWGGFRRYFNPSRSAATRELNRWIRETASVDAVVDAYQLLSCGDAERLCPSFMPPFKDGLHFGKLGHEKLGAALYQSVFARCL